MKKREHHQGTKFQNRARSGTNGGFLLMHSTGSAAHGVDIDKPPVYADYYYPEALHRYDYLLYDNLLKGRRVL